jgi:hypothetical protein
MKKPRAERALQLGKIDFFVVPSTFGMIFNDIITEIKYNA